MGFIRCDSTEHVVQNYRNLDLAHDIGIDYEHMQAHFPQIVYTHLNAYGVNGAWQNRPAFEQVVPSINWITAGI